MTQFIDRKELEYYLNLRYPVIVHEDPEGGFVAEIEELPGCMTQAETIDGVFDAIEDARKVWIETAYHDGYDIPLPRDMEKYPGKFLVRMPRSLHRDLVHAAKREGVSLNQYVTSLLAAGVSRGVIRPAAGSGVLVVEAHKWGPDLEIFGSTEGAIDWAELISMSQSEVKGKK